jgi:transposase InsO family protein
MRRFGFSTIEAWYYAARNDHKDPVGRLGSKPRSDIGKSRRISDDVVKMLGEQYAKHPAWSYKLHADNILVAVLAVPGAAKPPSYPTLRRYMKRKGLRKQRKVKRAATAIAINRVESLEVRSYEVEFVNSLWHLDYHKTDIKVLLPDGSWRSPVLLGIFDDHSRLACHLQWYLEETAENLVHGYSQALLKRGIPREQMSDNGSQMTGHEFTAGLARLAIIPKNTLVESPYQNGKCEHVWTRVDGRLMAMLESYKDLTLSFLNDATQAWAEMEYNRQVHGETGQTPIDRFATGKDVGRACPSPEALRRAFRREIKRWVRRSDGTIVIDRQRFEIPSRFRNFETVTIRYAFWDLSFVHMLDFRTGEEVCRLYPVDKVKNAEGLRRTLEDPVEVALPEPTKELPPLLKSLIDQYRDCGLLPAYLPKQDFVETTNDSK